MTKQQFLLHLSKKGLLGAAGILGLAQLGGLALTGTLGGLVYWALKNPPNYEQYALATGTAIGTYDDDDDFWDD